MFSDEMSNLVREFEKDCIDRSIKMNKEIAQNNKRKEQRKDRMDKNLIKIVSLLEDSKFNMLDRPLYEYLKPKKETKKMKKNIETKYLQEHIEELMKRGETFTLTPGNSPRNIKVIDKDGELISNVAKVEIYYGGLDSITKHKVDENGRFIFNKEKGEIETEIIRQEDMEMSISFKETE